MQLTTTNLTRAFRGDFDLTKKKKNTENIKLTSDCARLCLAKTFTTLVNLQLQLFCHALFLVAIALQHIYGRK